MSGLRRVILITDPDTGEQYELTGVKEGNKVSLHTSSESSVLSPDQYIFNFLQREDTSTGGIEMDIDGSGTPVVFSYSPGTGGGALLERANIMILDGGTRPTRFGGLSTLTNGINFEVLDTDGSQLFDFNEGEKIRINADFAYLAGSDVPIIDATGDDELAIRWTFSKAGTPLQLKETQKFQVTIRDDLTGLSQFRVKVQGTKFTP